MCEGESLLQVGWCRVDVTPSLPRNRETRDVLVLIISFYFEYEEKFLAGPVGFITFYILSAQTWWYRIILAFVQVSVTVNLRK